MDLVECSGCKAFMLWALTPSGAKAPIDYRPAESGNVLLLQPSGFGELLAVTLSGDGLQRARQRGMDLRTNHYATCPEAEQFRRRA
jgi:hypothetical protein